MSFVASPASSTLYVPITLTRIVRTGLSSTVSTPAIPAQWTMCVTPFACAPSVSASRTSPWTKVRFGCSRRSLAESASRWRLSSATISLRSTSRRASVVPMKPAPPVIRMRLPSSATRPLYPGYPEAHDSSRNSRDRADDHDLAGGHGRAVGALDAAVRADRRDVARTCRRLPQAQLALGAVPADPEGRGSARRSTGARRSRASPGASADTASGPSSAAATAARSAAGSGCDRSCPPAAARSVSPS